MKAISETAKLKGIAAQLGVPLRGTGDLSERIVKACEQKVLSWIDELGPVSTLVELIELVQAKVKLHFEIINTNDELKKIRSDYLAKGETGFIDLEREFDPHTHAVVLRLQKQPEWSNRKYVAVIDSRGEKSPREWFSKWHEIAHLIAEPQLNFAFRRTQEYRRDPLERLMDQIAARIGFLPSLMKPMLDSIKFDRSAPSLRSLIVFHEEHCRFASLQSTFIAALRDCDVPTILVEARLGFNKDDIGQLNQGTLFNEERPKPVLRAITTSHNPAAVRSKFFIHKNMRVPTGSIISSVFLSRNPTVMGPKKENLDWWESQNRSLSSKQVFVEAHWAGRVGGEERVLALIREPGN